MECFGSSKKSCFIEEDDGLASLADMEAGFSGTLHQSLNQNGFFSRSLFCHSRKSSLRNLTSWSVSPPPPPPRSAARFYDTRFEDHYLHHHQPHFLDACFLCKKPLGVNKDIFMYRGDTPFCSEECREEQIEMDEAMEKNRNLCSSMKLALRNKEQMRSKSSNKAQDYPFYTDTVAAA